MTIRGRRARRGSSSGRSAGDVELDVPAHKRPHAPRAALETVQGTAATAAEVDPNRADAGGVEVPNLGVGGVGGKVRDADEAGTQLGERGAQRGLVVTLEGPGDDCPADDAEGARACGSRRR